MAELEAGWRALARIDEVLGGRPKREGSTLKVAIQDLARFRDAVVMRHRAEGGTRWRPALEHVNAVLSVVMAMEFPIGEAPWHELEKARAWLDAVLRDEVSRPQ